MLGKIVNGALLIPSKDEFKKIVIVNPTEEQLKFVMGYKDLIVDEQPEITENQYIVPVFEETDEVIYQHYVVEETVKAEEENLRQEMAV